MAGYVGPAIRLGEIVSRPVHSLVVQSYKPREMQSGTVNADGYGAALWLDDGRPEPALYRTAVPIWADPNLGWMNERLRVRSVIAAVRSATPGIGGLAGAIERLERICTELDRTASVTVVIGDGEQLTGLRWAHGMKPATLYAAPFGEGVCMASEPLDAGRWRELPIGEIVTVRAGDLR